MAASKRQSPSRSPGRKPRRSYHHGNLRRALIDEALETIRAGGVDALTLREIGARVGVSRTAMYRHFADKGALLEAVATEGFRALREQLVAAWEGGRGAGALDAMGVAYVRFALQNQSHYRVMFGGAIGQQIDNVELKTEANAAFQSLVDALATLQREGILREDDTLLMATHVWSLVHGMAMLAIDRRFHQENAIEPLLGYVFGRMRLGISTGARPS